MRVLRPGPPACGARARVAGERERCGVCGHAPLVTTNPAPLVHSLRLLRRLPTLLGAQRGLPPAANVSPARAGRRWGQAELRLQPPALFPASVHGRLTQPPSFAPCSPCLRAVCVGMLAHPGPCAPQRERRREGTATRDWPLPRGGAGLPPGVHLPGAKCCPEPTPQTPHPGPLSPASHAGPRASH